jgi:hypothetical protein
MRANVCRRLWEVSTMSIRFSRAAAVSVIGLCSSLPILFASQSASAALGGAPMTPPASASTSSTTVTVPSTSGATSGTTAVMRSASSSAATSTTSSSGGSYTVRTTSLGNNNVVREYISASGDVFGLAWSGPQMPDLNSLLGSYFPQYVAGVANSRKLRGGRGPGIVQDSGLVVYSGGHMGAFSGQAYLPQALPAGVTAADIQ